MSTYFHISKVYQMHIYLCSYIHISAIRACLGNSGVGGVRWRGVKGVGAPSSRQFHKVCCGVLQRELQRELQCGFVLVHKAALYCSVSPCVAVCPLCINISYVCVSTFLMYKNICVWYTFDIWKYLEIWTLVYQHFLCMDFQAHSLNSTSAQISRPQSITGILGPFVWSVFLFCYPFGGRDTLKKNEWFTKILSSFSAILLGPFVLSFSLFCYPFGGRDTLKKRFSWWVL